MKEEPRDHLVCQEHVDNLECQVLTGHLDQLEAVDRKDMLDHLD